MKTPLLVLVVASLLCACSHVSAISEVSSATNPTPQIVRLDPRFDPIVPKDVALEKVADGFAWAEGPVWNRAGGFLLFSDVPNNAIIKWKAGETASVLLKPSGYTGKEQFTGREPGSNGLTYDAEGRLVFCREESTARST